jgi:hypothetical protein
MGAGETSGFGLTLIAKRVTTSVWFRRYVTRGLSSLSVIDHEHPSELQEHDSAHCGWRGYCWCFSIRSLL